MTAVRRVLRLMNPLTMAGGSWRTTAGRNRWTPAGVLSISTLVAFFSALSAEAFIIIIPIPTVEITSLGHNYSSSSGTTEILDWVNFPCGSGLGSCSSSGFTAAIANGDEIIMRFEAPSGERFHVFDDSALANEYLTVIAGWQAAMDTGNVFSQAVVNFENLTGTAPATQIDNRFIVTDAGAAVAGLFERQITGGDFTFTALTFTFTVSNSPPGATASFGAVGVPFNISGPALFGVEGGGPGTPADQILMQLEPLPDTDGDGVPDLTDNCPFTPNGPLLGTCLGDFPQGQAICHVNSDCTSGKCSLNQEDTGGVGTGSPPDGIGDACQCGDVDNNGIVNNTDATLIKRAVAGIAPYPGGVTTLPGYHKCQVVNGAPGLTCNNTQATIIQRAVAGLAPGIVQGCHAATIFP